MLESDWLLTAHIYYLILLTAAPKLSDLTCLVTKSLSDRPNSTLESPMTVKGFVPSIEVR